MPSSGFILGLLLFYAVFVDGVFQLRPISTIYIPSGYDSDDSPSYEIDGGAIEQSAYDNVNKLVYGAGSSFIHVIDFSNASNPIIIKKVHTPGVANDIELCGDFVAVTVSNNDPYQPGTVLIFSLYNKTDDSFQIIQNITVGSEPDMLKFTKNCRSIVVANEGEAFTSTDGNDIVNPEGSLSIITFASNDLSKSPNVSNADFQKFNSMSDELEAKYVRYPYKGYISKQKDTFSQNMEPEYIAFSSDESKAYVALQENNAIAIVDMATSSVEYIVGLGIKSWKDLKLDASDKDSGINMKSWPVYSFYQPDSIIHYEINGVEYIATANEGDSITYRTDDSKWEEDKRGEKLVKESLLSGNMSQTVKMYLENKVELGRLQFSTVDGLDNDGKIETLFHYGGRSWSIFRIENNNLTMLYDSGDEIERMMALNYPDVFNGDTKPDDPSEETPEELFDSRSDNKGPECESLAFGEIDGNKLIFVGNDRSSSIMIYKLSTEGHPTFQSIFRAGGTDETFTALLDKRNLGDLDPEDLRFIPKDESPTGSATLLVTSTVSGTLTLYEIPDVQDTSPSSTYQLKAVNLLLIITLAAISKFLTI
ncbi:mesenchyme-specific cell surface glycoprotein-like [Antedon mediterranea]|uniref:mesenchyme-specific cell surface glycoprotein-like n=1 Tax=Antedon mediterranea TaxID=105859 RepID=UPI003AF8B48F